MPSLPPDGQTPPRDGALPAEAMQGFGARPFQVYVHVPFCASRCGYCDFNTYTAAELGNDVRRESFGPVLQSEIDFAYRVTGSAPVATVFVGGGTPPMLGSAALVDVLRRIDATWGLADGAEITTEANPDSVTAADLEALRAGGFTRMSFGVQSAATSVLRVLERTHADGSARQAISDARAAGFEHVSADLIIGTPGETDDDVRRSVDLVLEAGVDHVSAYTLIVEPSTPLARRVARGDVPMPDDDVAAHRYELVDQLLRDAGLQWYEISNWARPGAECRHNLGYWRDADWWGIGPGAHSHIGGVRWWNARHPRTYAAALASGESPAQGREQLSAADRSLEAMMLGLRLREGVPVALVDESALGELELLSSQGLVESAALVGGRVVLTGSGRLVADWVIRRLTP